MTLWMFAAAAEENMGAAAGKAQAQDTEFDAETSLITSGDVTTSGRRATDGPSVEYITGGNSTDGAAKVGRLPVID